MSGRIRDNCTKKVLVNRIGARFCSVAPWATVLPDGHQRRSQTAATNLRSEMGTDWAQLRSSVASREFPFRKNPHRRRRKFGKLRVISFIRLAQIRIQNELAVPRVGFPCRCPELLQPLVMTTNDRLHLGRLARQLPAHERDEVLANPLEGRAGLFPIGLRPVLYLLAQFPVKQDLLERQELRRLVEPVAIRAVVSGFQQAHFIVEMKRAHADARHRGQFLDCVSHRLFFTGTTKMPKAAGTVRDNAT